MNRRRFLGISACASVAILTGSRTAFATDAEIEITPQPPGPEISPNLYGHFIEHLGGVIYDGVWVGPNSKIPNINGIRKQFVDDMKHLRAPNLRWPGGCFADGYHWRDGIGAHRPRTYNYWQASMPAGYDHTEPNAFGIHEFMQLCRLTGAEPYLAANMNSGSPGEFHDWVSYCNAPAGTLSLADERAANGDKDPFAVKWWGVGNESWGCGGDMNPAEYANLYRRFVTQFPAYEPKPILVAVGPRGHAKDLDLDWTRSFFESMTTGGHRSRIDGLSIHYYTDFRKSQERVSTFDAGGWFDVLREGARIESVIEQHWAIMAKYDPEHHTKLVVDEWGVWYPIGEEIAPNYLLSQPLTLRDALHTAITFDIFNRHADKIAMANVAQTINCIHSLFLAKGDQYVRTPVYSVFEMYRPHMGAQQAQLRIHCEDLKVPSRTGTSATMPALSGSASTQGKTLTVTLTNPSLDAPLTAKLRLTAGDIIEGKGTILTHANMSASNTFDHPTEVQPAPFAVSIHSNSSAITLPPRSIVALELRLA